MPKGVFIPVYVDAGHQYIVRVWHGAAASNRDLNIADKIVASIRFMI